MKWVFISIHAATQHYQQDASFIYRAQSLGLALMHLGHTVVFKHLSELNGREMYDVVILQRPKWSLRLALWVAWIKRRGARVWADFDDLVFDPAYAEFSPAVINGKLSLQKIQQRFKAHQRALNLVEGVLVSTAALRDYGLATRPELNWQVLPNTVHYHWRQRYDQQPIPRINWASPLISYFSGTASHDQDFALFADPLRAFLHDHPHIRLQLLGSLQHSLHLPVTQLIQQPKVPFAQYADYVQPSWLNLMPLHMTPFSRCKSALKVIEAAYWERPTLCTAIPDTARLKGRGALEVQPDELYAQLKQWLNPDDYAQYTQGLRQRMLRVAAVEDQAKQLIATINP